MRQRHRYFWVHTLVRSFLVCNIALAIPVFIPQFNAGGTGRNIRHLPCASRKTGETGVCMFALSCAKSNGTHLGTCIDRFYFGSCCKLNNNNNNNNNNINSNINNNAPIDEPVIVPSQDNAIDSDSSSSIGTTFVTPPPTTIPAINNAYDSNDIPGNVDKNKLTNNNYHHHHHHYQQGSSSSSSSSRLPETYATTVKSVVTSLTKVKPQKIPVLTKKPPLTIPETSTQSIRLSTFQTVQNATERIDVTTPKDPSTDRSPLTTTTTTKTSSAPSSRPKPSSSSNYGNKPIVSILPAYGSASSSSPFFSYPTTFRPTVTGSSFYGGPEKPTSTAAAAAAQTIKISVNKHNRPEVTGIKGSAVTTTAFNRPPHNYSSTSALPSTVVYKTQSTPPLSSSSSSSSFSSIYNNKLPSTQSVTATLMFNKTSSTTTTSMGSSGSSTRFPPRNSTTPSPSTSHHRVTDSIGTTTILTSDKYSDNSDSQKLSTYGGKISTTKKPIKTSVKKGTTASKRPTYTTTTAAAAATTGVSFIGSNDQSVTDTTSWTTEGQTIMTTLPYAYPFANDKPTTNKIFASTSKKPTSNVVIGTKKPTTTMTSKRPVAVTSSTLPPPSSVKAPPVTTTTTHSANNKFAQSTSTKTSPLAAQKKPSTATSTTTTTTSVFGDYVHKSTAKPYTKFGTTSSSSKTPSTTVSSNNINNNNNNNGWSTWISMASTARPTTTTTTTTTVATKARPSIVTTSTPTTWITLPEEYEKQTDAITESTSLADFENDVYYGETATPPPPAGVVTWNSISDSEGETATSNAEYSSIAMDNTEKDWISVTVQQMTTTQIPKDSVEPKPAEFTTEKSATSTLISTLGITPSNVQSTSQPSTYIDKLSTLATVTVSPQVTDFPLNVLNMSNFKDVCGRRLYPEPRIVGGNTSNFGKWPWQISLRQWRTSTYLHKCGAALLNENWAITAAHCVQNVIPSDLLLRIGEHDLGHEDEPYTFQERRVQIVASHPNFDPRTFEFDLALMRFYEPVLPFQPNVLPICIPDDDEDYVGQTAYVTGWGRLYEDGPLPSILQEVAVPVINNTFCEGMYRNAGYIEHIPHIFICAGWKKGGFDSCEGDSGGPLVIQRKRDRRWILAGVISWGIGCAEPNQPGVYTRISEFREWINQILQF